MKTIKSTLLLLLAGWTLTGCGIYSFSGSTLPSHIKTVGVPLFVDQTSEFGIDRQITDGLITAITQDNTLKIAAPRQADALLQGTILRVTDTADNYNQAETASDFRITIEVKIVFEDVKKRQTLWEERWSQWGRYDNQETTREDGIAQAVEKLAAEVLNRTVSGW